MLSWGAIATPCTNWVTEIVSIQGTIKARKLEQKVWSLVALGDRFCAGDSVQVGSHSRAGLLLQNGTLLRLDQGTTLILPSLDDESSAWMELIQGALHLISNIPYRLKIKTPFMNASIEGTEFAVRVSQTDGRLWVVEGQVLVENSLGSMRVGPGKAALAQAGKPPAPYVKITPKDAVQWAIYYPPIIDYRATDNTIWKRAVELYRNGDIPVAIDTLDSIPDKARDGNFFSQRAAFLLTVGQVDAARNDIAQARNLSPESGTPLALESIIALVRNEKEKARTLAEKAVETEPESAIPYAALSYVQQSEFDIKGALNSIKKSLERSPDDALAWSRLSELELSTGNLDAALDAARKAEALDPGLSHTQMVLGFAHLLNIDIEEATESFQKAIDLSPSSPLPRLGLGLAKIRQGDVEEGTKDIEVAAILDPENSLIRSYLGKAYYDERRSAVASREFSLAKQLDPKDPTPWFYDAIQKQTTNRPIEALHDMQKAIKLNGNRAVYRSSFLLDDDLAARSASLGRIYTNLGFEQIGLLEGWKSQNLDPSSSSTHRLLADTYAGLPRHQIARVSELLQSQLLQPLNITPVQPQLAQRNLLIFDGLGPASPSFNEFNPLFARNRLALQASGLFASNETYGDEVVQSGVYDRYSYSLGQYHYQTDGYRPNSDLNSNIYNVFFQTFVSKRLNFQLEYRKELTTTGDIRRLIDPDFLFAGRRQHLDQDYARFGFNFQIDPDINLIGHLSYGHLQKDTTDPGFESFQSILNGNPISAIFAPLLVPNLPNGFLFRDDFTNDADNWSGELQMIGRWSRLNLIAGASHVNQSRLSKRIQSNTLSSQLDPNLVSNLSTSIPSFFAQFLVDNLVQPIIFDRTNGGMPSIIEESTNENHTAGYLYSIIKAHESITLTLGGSIDSIDRDSSLGTVVKFNPTYVNPKVGLIWEPLNGTTVRAAWFKTVKRAFASDQTLEPTHVAGFNQFFDDPDYTRSTRYGFGLNQHISDDLMLGGEVSWRDVKTQRFIFGIPEIDDFTQDESVHRAYAYWTPNANIAISADYFYESFDRHPRSSVPTGTPLTLTTQRVPLSLSYFNENGLFGNFVATYVDQTATLRSNVVDRAEQENFWVFDATMGYRLPQRYGILSFGIKNIFDNRFRFQDTNFNVVGAIEGGFLPPTYIPQRIFFGQLTLAF